MITNLFLSYFMNVYRASANIRNSKVALEYDKIKQDKFKNIAPAWIPLYFDILFSIQYRLSIMEVARIIANELAYPKLENILFSKLNTNGNPNSSSGFVNILVVILSIPIIHKITEAGRNLDKMT